MPRATAVIERLKRIGFMGPMVRIRRVSGGGKYSAVRCECSTVHPASIMLLESRLDLLSCRVTPDKSEAPFDLRLV